MLDHKDWHNGDKCPDGQPGQVKFTVNGKQTKGDPTTWKLRNGDYLDVGFIDDQQDTAVEPGREAEPGQHQRRGDGHGHDDTDDRRVDSDDRGVDDLATAATLAPRRDHDDRGSTRPPRRRPRRPRQLPRPRHPRPPHQPGMRAVILVGGEGTRLRPLTYTVPKQMLPVVEVPMIERVVGHLVAHGVTDVILSLGYRPDAFIEAYPDSRCAGATARPTSSSRRRSTPPARSGSPPPRRGSTDTFLVFNGDVLTDLDITALVRFHRERGAEGTIALTPVEDPSRVRRRAHRR